MAWIFDRYNYNQRLQLGREEFIRPLPMGTNWQSLRIGIRFCMNDASRVGFNTVSSWGFGIYLGVQEGMTTSFLAETVTDWIGGGAVGSVYPPTGALGGGFTLGTPNYWTANMRPNALRKAGASNTFGTESSVSTFITGSGLGGVLGSQFMEGLYIDITKGSPNYSFNIFYPSTAVQAQTNITSAAFLTNVESTGTPTQSTASGAKTVAYSGNALFDHLSVVYTRFWPHLEIDGIAAVRLT